jgi:hypothetical protein
VQERTKTEGGIPLRSLDVVHKRSTSNVRKREREEDSKRVFRGLALFLGQQPSGFPHSWSRDVSRAVW